MPLPALWSMSSALLVPECKERLIRRAVYILSDAWWHVNCMHVHHISVPACWAKGRLFGAEVPAIGAPDLPLAARLVASSSSRAEIW